MEGLVGTSLSKVNILLPANNFLRRNQKLGWEKVDW
jgi:hypothetical protein